MVIGGWQDVELSKEVNETFRQSAQARQNLPQGCEMSVHVLTSGYWPSYHPMEVRLPHELSLYQVRGVAEWGVGCLDWP